MLQSLSLWRELAHDMFSAQGEAPAGGGAGGSGGAGEAGGEGGWVEGRGPGGEGGSEGGGEGGGARLASLRNAPDLAVRPEP